MSDKIVVTGGAGFIGGHIVQHWLEAGAKVHIVDNLRSGHQVNVDRFPSVEFHRSCITNRDAVFAAIEGARYVFHLAAMISVPESMEKLHECVDINVTGLLNVLDAAREHGAEKVVYSSSAAVYGDNPVLPKTVSMRPIPKSPYGITKLDGEYYLQMYNQEYGLGTASLRYFNVFGPGQDPNSHYAAAIPIFVSKALKNEPLTLFGDGMQTRDFVFVKDVAAANVLAARTPLATGVYNVARGESITIKKIAELVIQQTESTSELIYAEERPGDIKHSLASIEETKDAFSFDPKYELVEGLKQTVQYFMDLFKV
ncbi:MAG: NAD-dependent epimerase/dehydratase family protein [Gemmatimonadota bacterium]|nr:NAD-dependent epimerase/dehydratase family protein [Gemmatimonadota bacterium]